MRDDIINVGMADYKICRPPQKIATLGLGSCLGVVLYDRKTRLCGMAHIMLPDSRRISDNSNRMKFADTCLADMHRDLLKRNVRHSDLVARVAGGARLFRNSEIHDVLNVGAQNIVAVRKILSDWSIPVISENVGEYCGRTIVFDPATGELSIRIVNIGSYA